MMSPLLKLDKLLIAALICLVTACGGSNARKAQYLEEGKRLFAAGDYQKAQLSFKNVLQIDPKYMEARYQLAETLSKLGNVQEAIGQYLAIVNEDPKHLMARIRMGQVYLLANKGDDAEKMAKEARAIDPENIEGMVLTAGVLAYQKSTDASITQLDAALKKQPDDVPANMLMASLNAKSGKFDQAIERLQRNSEKNPSVIAPRLMLANLYAQTKAMNKAQQALESIIRVEPQKMEHRKRLALFLVANNRLDDAEAVLRDAVKELPDNADAPLTLIDFLTEKRTPQIAVAELLPMIERHPDQYDLRFKLAALQLAENRVDEAERTLKKIVELDGHGPQSIKARNKLARLYTATKRTEEAKGLVKQIIDENPRDGEALSLRGEFALAEHKIPDAIGDFRAVLVDQPQSIKVLKLLSAAYLMNNDPVLARENMEKVVEMAPNDEGARLDLANLLLQTGDSDRAIQQIDALLNANKNSKRGLEAAYKINLAKKQWEKAQEFAQRLQEAYADEGLGYYLSGLAFQAEDKFDNSVTAFEKSLAKQPDAVEPLTQLVKSFLSLKQANKAENKLNDVIKRQPKNFVAYNLLGGIYLSDKKFGEAMSAFKKAAAIKPDWPSPYRNMATAYFAKSEKAEAIKIYQDGIVKTKGSSELVNDLLNLYHREGQHDKVVAMLEDVYKQHPDSKEAVNNLASYLSDYAKDSADLDRAAKMAQTLAESNNPNMLDTVGWIAYKQGSYGRAQALLSRVVELDPGSAISNYHLGMTYYKQNDLLKAKDYLQKAVDKKVDFIGLDAAKGTLKMLVGEDAAKKAG